jgi:hypothetical protein
MNFKTHTVKIVEDDSTVPIDDLCMFKVTVTFLGHKDNSTLGIFEGIQSTIGDMEYEEKIPKNVTVESSDVSLSDVEKVDRDWEVSVDDEYISVREILTQVKPKSKSTKKGKK